MFVADTVVVASTVEVVLIGIDDGVGVSDDVGVVVGDDKVGAEGEGPMKGLHNISHCYTLYKTLIWGKH